MFGKFRYMVWLSLLFLLSCGQGLNEVEGFAGKVFLPQDSTGAVIPFPDTLKAAVVVVAPYQLYSSVDSFLVNLLAYSDPIDSMAESTEFFIQTLPGVYLAGVVGLKVPLIELLFMPPDSLANHPEYFIPLGIYTRPSFPFSGVEVKKNQITPDVNINIDYSFTLPFK